MSKCKSCKDEYTKRSMAQIVCSPQCAYEYTKAQNLKKRKAETKKRKEKLKTVGMLKKEAQIAVNAFIRARDYGKPCISCGRSTGCKMNAGHFRAVGGCPELRFNTLNIHLQCEHCNNFLSGNPLEYRKRLVNLYGVDRVEWLEGKHELTSYTRDDLRRIKKIFTKRKRIYENLI